MSSSDVAPSPLIRSSMTSLHSSSSRSVASGSSGRSSITRSSFSSASMVSFENSERVSAETGLNSSGAIARLTGTKGPLGFDFSSIRTVLVLCRNAGAQVAGGAGNTSRHRRDAPSRIPQNLVGRAAFAPHMHLRRAPAVAQREPARPCAAPARSCGLAQALFRPFITGGFAC